MEKYAVIVAGGSGSRMKSNLPKQFLSLRDRPILIHTLEGFAKADASIHLILVLPKAQIPFWQELCEEHSFNLSHQIVEGGASRYQSVSHGLARVPEGMLVAIHDGVRPFATPELIQRSYQMAEEHGNAVVAVPPKQSLRVLKEGRSEAVDRSLYRIVQTPQTFQSTLLKKAFELGEKPHFTDDASVLEFAGHEIRLIEGDYKNIKITTPEDLPMAEAIAQTLDWP